MGFTESYSAPAATRRAATLSAAGVSAFAHSDAMAKAERSAQRVHDLLAPWKMVNGRRECRPSTTHPDPTPIIVAFDVTGSMLSCPKVLQGKLGTMIDDLRGVAGVASPQVLIAAFDDAYADEPRKSLQVGQFEPGEEMANDLSKVWLTNNGGGSGEESSDLVLHFAAHHTDIAACARKGFLFIFTDEKAYTRGDESILHDVFGNNTPVQNLAQIVDLALAKYEIFVLTPTGTSHYNDPELSRFWNNLLPGRHLRIGAAEHANTVVTAIVGRYTGALTDQAARNLLGGDNLVPHAELEALLAACTPLAQPS
jgi:hypothetical protein